MAEQSLHRRIERPAVDVWATLADFGAISAWAPNVDHSSLLNDDAPDPDGASRIGLVRRIQTGRRTILERVVRWDDGTALAYELEGLPKVIRSARNEWRLEPTGPAATQVSLTSTVDCGPRPPQQLVARLVAKKMAKESELLMSGLTRSLEADRG
jgi:hypothetical protein